MGVLDRLYRQTIVKSRKKTIRSVLYYTSSNLVVHRKDNRTQKLRETGKTKYTTTTVATETRMNTIFININNKGMKVVRRKHFCSLLAIIISKSCSNIISIIYKKK